MGWNIFSKAADAVRTWRRHKAARRRRRHYLRLLRESGAEFMLVGRFDSTEQTSKIVGVVAGLFALAAGMHLDTSRMMLVLDESDGGDDMASILLVPAHEQSIVRYFAEKLDDFCVVMPDTADISQVGDVDMSEIHVIAQVNYERKPDAGTTEPPAAPTATTPQAPARVLVEQLGAVAGWTKAQMAYLVVGFITSRDLDGHFISFLHDEARAESIQDIGVLPGRNRGTQSVRPIGETAYDVFVSVAKQLLWDAAGMLTVACQFADSNGIGRDLATQLGSTVLSTSAASEVYDPSAVDDVTVADFDDDDFDDDDMPTGN